MKVDLSEGRVQSTGEIFSLAGMVLDGYGRGSVPEETVLRIGTEDLR